MRKLIPLLTGWLQEPKGKPKDNNKITHVTFEEYFKEDNQAYQQ